MISRPSYVLSVIKVVKIALSFTLCNNLTVADNYCIAGEFGELTLFEPLAKESLAN